MDGLSNWVAAIAALRLLAVVRGDVFPREDEHVDIVLLAALRR